MRIIFARRAGLLVEENALSHVTYLPRKMIGGCNVKMAEGTDLISSMNVEELLPLVRTCIFQNEPTFLECFHDAVDTAGFCAGWFCESCCDAAARESLAKNGLCMRVWISAFGGGFA